MFSVKGGYRAGIAMVVLSATTLSARVFTDKAGNSYDGSVVNITDSVVTIMVPARGKFVKVPLASLSAQDRAYVESLGKRRANPRVAAKAAAKEAAGKTVASRSSRGASSSKLKAEYNLVDNFLTPWPRFISVPKAVHVRVVSQDKGKKRYVYHSPSFEFISDVALSTTIISEFGLMFEATREYCRKLPLSNMKAHVPKHQGRNRILLFESVQSYVRNGGHPNAAGVYVPSRNLILIPLQSLGVKKKGGVYNYDYQVSNSVLVHEIVHQLTDPEYFAHGGRGWFSEGLAQYCAETRYSRGGFSVSGVRERIKDYVVGTATRGGLGAKINAPDLEAFMLQSYQSFTGNAGVNYRLGTMITYYFFHMERDRRNLARFLQALKRGETGSQALKYLLNGRSFKQLERDIHNAWRSSGVVVNFQ